jgi:hypothetical protein
MIFVLKITYSDIILKITAAQEILKFYQEKHSFKNFPPE